MREGDPACPLRGEERTASLAHVPSVCRVGTWGSGAHDGGLPGAHLCPVLIGQHVLRPRPAGDTPQIQWSAGRRQGGHSATGTGRDGLLKSVTCFALFIFTDNFISLTTKCVYRRTELISSSLGPRGTVPGPVNTLTCGGSSPSREGARGTHPSALRIRGLPGLFATRTWRGPWLQSPGCGGRLCVY